MRIILRNKTHYGLRCRNCGHEFQKSAWGILEYPDKICPRCLERDPEILSMVEPEWDEIECYGC